MMPPIKRLSDDVESSIKLTFLKILGPSAFHNGPRSQNYEFIAACPIGIKPDVFRDV